MRFKKGLKIVFLVSMCLSNCIVGPDDDVPKLQITEEEKKILREFFDVNGRSDISLERASFVRTNASMQVDTLIISNFPFDSLIITSSFMQLSDLKYIGISNTYFTDVPEEFASLPSLIELKINSSPFQFITENILSISSLEALTMTNCPIEELPSDIDRLSNLNTLGVSYSNITTIPHEILNLQNLNKLILVNNRINSLPPEIINSDIKDFRIWNNSLCDLDSLEIAWLSKYQNWDAQNCN